MSSASTVPQVTLDLPTRSAPAVTVGIPFFNAERTLPDAIRSVFCQTFSDWELILLDDGSSDGSLSIARAVADPRVRVVSDGRHLTLATRLNQFASLARAPILMRMDADDLMHPRRIEAQARFLGDHADIDVVGTGAITIDAEKAPTGKRGLGPLENKPVRVAISGLLMHPTVAGRTDWFRRNAYCEEEWAVRAEDAELWLRTLKSSRFAVIPEPLLFYSEVPGEILSRTLASYRSTTRLLSHARERGILSFAEASAGAALQTLKSWLLPWAWRLGLSIRVIGKRNAPLEATERSEASLLLARILSHPVPGLAAHRLDCEPAQP